MPGATTAVDAVMAIEWRKSRLELESIEKEAASGVKKASASTATVLIDTCVMVDRRRRRGEGSRRGRERKLPF